MKGSRVKPLGIGQEIEVGLMGDNPRLDPIHRDGFPLAARKALHRRRCASAILARPAVVFGPVARIDEALEATKNTDFDLAILDASLDGEPSRRWRMPSSPAARRSSLPPVMASPIATGQC
jgi:hypothetical protein